MTCPYGECRMVNLCRNHCVRKALEDNGWRLNTQGDLEKINESDRRSTKLQPAR